jgi:hypothetical protein
VPFLYVEKNITATQEFVRDLSHAKDIQDMFRIQMEFMRAQLEAFGKQANSLGEAYIKRHQVKRGSRPRPILNHHNWITCPIIGDLQRQVGNPVR